MGCSLSTSPTQPTCKDNTSNGQTPSTNSTAITISDVKVECDSTDLNIDMTDPQSELPLNDSPPIIYDVIALQGSSTYLLKALGLDGVIVTVGMIKVAIQTKLDELRSLNILDAILVNNLVYANFIFERQLHLENTTLMIAKREFVDSDGNILATQLPAGYVAEDIICRMTKTDFVVIDCGTGEFKPFNVTSIPDKTYRSVVATTKHDATPFYTHITNILKEWAKSHAADISIDLAALKKLFNTMCPNINDIKTVCIGTQKFRDLAIEYNQTDVIALFGMIHHNLIFQLLSPEYESLYEFAAISNAFKHGVQPEFYSELVADAPNPSFNLIGNIAWGNGSGQGVFNTRKFDIDVGLKTILEYVDTNFSKWGTSCTFGVNIETKKYTNLTPDTFDILMREINTYLDTSAI